MWKVTPFLRNRYILLLFAGISVFTACKNQVTISFDEKEDERVAKVGSAILYEKDVANVVKKEAGEDSGALRERFVNNWIRKELLLQTAKMNLSKEELDIEERVQDYRASLLINQYKQKYLSKHLDTLVTKENVALYVAEHTNSFVLKEPLYRYYLAKVLKKNKDDEKLLKTLFSKEEVNLMQDFDLENTTVIGSYDVDWYTGKEILEKLPENIDKKDLKNLKIGKISIFKDENSVYLLRPVGIAKEGEMSPQDYIYDKVREIILHNRKIALAKQLEYEIYEVAKTKNQFEVY